MVCGEFPMPNMHGVKGLQSAIKVVVLRGVALGGVSWFTGLWRWVG